MKFKILMVGPHRTVQGGISSVVNVYYRSELIKTYSILYLASHIDGGKLIKLLQFLKSLLQFLHYMRKFGIKIVHIHTASNASFYRKSIIVLLSKIFKKKIILHIHGANFNEFYHSSNPILKRFIRGILSQSDTLVALSNRWKEKLQMMTNHPERIKVLYNPVVLPEFPERTSENKIKILFMGRLGKRKGTYDLLECAKKITEKLNQVQFILCGDGDTEIIKNLVIAKGLTQWIEVRGWIHNRDETLRNADIYVLPSYFEGLPMSVLEAASFGLPVVSTKVGGIDEIIENGINGFLINPGDTEKLTDHLVSLIESKELRQIMGINSYSVIKNKFDIRIIQKQLSTLYEAHLNESH